MAQAACIPDVTSTPMPQALRNSNAIASLGEVATYSRPLLLVSTIALFVLFVVNIPPFLQTAIDCDPILFDLFARDMGRGGVLYRDMVENNTPTMIAMQSVIRKAFGHSTTAIRIVDLLVVGFGIALLARWFRPGRPDLHVLSFTLISVLYLTTTEWCHVQRDVWLLLPVMVSLYLRRRQLFRQVNGRNSFAMALLEGLVWGFAVWLKPYAIVVGAIVWFAGAAWAYSRGASLKLILTDALGLLLSGLFAGIAGIAAMHGAGILLPYLDHLSNWGSEYRGADLYGKVGKWFFRLGFMIRNAPWSILYLIAIPAAVVMAIQPILTRKRATAMGNNEHTDRPDTVLLGAALAAWAFQAWFLQHIFDYAHIAGEMFAVAILIELAASQPSIFKRRMALLGMVVITAIGHGVLFNKRLKVWGECVTSKERPELRDKLARFERIAWADLDRVAQFLRAQNVAPGELNIISDNALPLWEMVDQTPPTRYYIVQNNMLAFRSHHPEIKKALSELPNQKYLVFDLAAIRWEVDSGYNWNIRGDWPLLDDWYGPRRWADRIVFRSGRYAVVSISAPEVPQWIADVTDH